jgi:rhodanese-related sulfurtransferase
MGLSWNHRQNESKGVLEEDHLAAKSHRKLKKQAISKTLKHKMKSQIVKILSELKPRPKEILGAGITFVVFFVIALLVNGVRSEPLKIWGSETRVERAKAGAKSAEVENAAKWEYCDVTDMDTLIREDDAIVIDARPGLFYKMGHIPGAISLPATTKDLGGAIRKVFSGVPAGKIIAVYCADKNCENAEAVAKQLAQAGYNRISIFSGGWAEWEETGREIEK